MPRAVIGIGSNIEPKQNFERVRPLLEGAVSVERYATLRRTQPLGDPDQPAFLNSGALVRTDFDKATLKRALRAIEKMLGRVRTRNPNAPRTMDLDILVWEGTVVDPDVAQRPFLQEIIRELWPGIL
jgi:2-amino-4-hydroxy-6-hydroxymethyldihydropteridine diphosphokinase